MPSPDLPQVLIAGVVTAVLAWAAFSDLRRRIIPNWTAIAMVVGFVAATACARGDGLVGRLAAGALALAAGYALFLARIVGGGDAKLFAATALYLGIGNLPVFMLAMSLIGGVMAAGFLVARGRSPAASHDLPYGVAIAAAGVLTTWSALPPPA